MRRWMVAMTSVLAGACATPRIDFVELVPTIKGKPVANVVSPTQADVEAPAGVAWSSVWSPGRKVLIFDDHVTCVRLPQRIGKAINGDTYDASTPEGAAMIRLDYLAAEEDALESGIDVSAVDVWILVGVSAANLDQPAVRVVARLRGRFAAEQLLRAGHARSAKVATIWSTRNSLELLLTPQNDRSMITNTLGVAVSAPRAIPTERPALEDLMRGPEPETDVVMDNTVVSVWFDGERQSWAYPFHPSGEPNERDVKFMRAFDTIASALENGCVIDEGS